MDLTRPSGHALAHFVAPAALDVFVPGLPVPGGSKRAFVIPGTGRANVTDANPRAKGWKADVKVVASHAWGDRDPLDGPIHVEVVFTLPRPKGHFGTGRNARTLKPRAPSWHTSKPDATKLWRPVEDALTGVVWRDDSQIADQHATKRYGDRPGVRVVVRKILSP